MTTTRDLRPEELTAARHLLSRASAFLPAARVAEEKLFGAAPLSPPQRALALDYEGRLAGVAVASAGYLRLLAVDPSARGRGLGSELLTAAEATIANAGADTARLMAQPGNYLAPGVPRHDTETLGWLERRGWTRQGENTNLQVALDGNAKVSLQHAAALEQELGALGYVVRRAEAAERERVCDFVRREFFESWAFEVGGALVKPAACVYVAEDAAGEVVAFAAHDGNNSGLGSFGPAGTAPEHRGRKLGNALLVRCLLDIRAKGHETGTIAWVGPREFYERSVGIIGETPFVVLTKQLS